MVAQEGCTLYKGTGGGGACSASFITVSKAALAVLVISSSVLWVRELGSSSGKSIRS